MLSARNSRRPLAAAMLVVLLTSGCVSGPYRHGFREEYRVADELAAINTPPIERGEPRRVIDAVGWLVGLPDRILFWNRRVENHKISPETEQAIAEYLAANDLATVKVRLNQYAPRDEWRRLVANTSVGWGWRYTFGVVAWLGETVFPGRLIGGDHYNPYTNTIHLYSDVPAIAIHEGGHAKDFARRQYKGTYAAIYLLPVAPLWYEAIATNDALSYLRSEGSLEDEQAADRILYPAYGTYLGDAVSVFVPQLGWPLYLGGLAAGHIAGRLQANRLEQDRPFVPAEQAATVRPESP